MGRPGHPEPPAQNLVEARPTPRVLLKTKVTIPTPRREWVSRADLIPRLGTSSLPKLVLIDAPAGWGKTTLLTQWCARDVNQACFAWLSLDSADNDPVRFWTYVVEALSSVAPGLGEDALSSLAAPGTSIVGDFLPRLLNDAATPGDRLILILDDYHSITNIEIQEGLAFTIEHLPPRLRLVVATRSDPALPLARLRARGDMLEMRIGDLRFSREEADSLLNDALSLGLSQSSVTHLHDRTEGWAAGLYLAVLSMRNHPDPSAFIEEFAGNDRNIVDFLSSEVLSGQSEETRDFLVKTSILERLTGPLCDAVTKETNSAERLENIERENLFLVPLDNTRRWFRYHGLFAQLLRHELGRHESELVSELHRRASSWHRRAGSVSAAIRHAIAAGDFNVASDLITDHWYGYLQRGRLATVGDWLDALGDERVANDPRLCLTKAWMGINTGRLGEIHRWIAAAERATLDGWTGVGNDMVETGTASLRAIHRYMSGEVTEAVGSGGIALKLERRGQTSPWHPVGCPVLGVALFWSGHGHDARDELHQALREARAGGNNLSELHALGGLAAIEAEHGDLLEAERLATASSRAATEHGLEEHWASSLALIVRGKALMSRGDFDGAHDVIRRGVELSQRGIARLETAYALIALAEVQHAMGRLEESRRTVVEARAMVESCPDPGILAEKLAKVEIRTVTGGRARYGPASLGDLSDREYAVLRLLPSELSQREIGNALFVSHNTVKTHVRSIFRKLDASSRDEAVATARDRGLL
ncbi:MAG: LuxR C-terminal-related transcriptional regulator [Actinomycetota bacterium]|nr:LuxR C-terminal-related transcriptional regulator [Actinomycetota bacterium]